MTFPVEMENLSVSFKSAHGRVDALSDVSFRVKEGSVVGFLGPNGAGKTTAMHVLLGFVKPTAGRACIFGKDVRYTIARQNIGYLPEHPRLYRFLTGRELLKMAGRLFGISGTELNSRIDGLILKVGLLDAANRRIGTYSRGMMQRIGVAQALINNPDLVILDEPTGGLDPLGRLEMRDIIIDLKEQGKTVFFSSHELSEVERVCDQVIMLSDGKILTQGGLDELVKGGRSLEQYFVEMVRSAKEGSSL